MNADTLHDAIIASVNRHAGNDDEETSLLTNALMDARAMAPAGMNLPEMVDADYEGWNHTREVMELTDQLLEVLWLLEDAGVNLSPLEKHAGAERAAIAA